MEYTAIIEKTPNGWYIAQCEQVPGALTQGRTLEEVQENLKEAIFLVLESEKELGIRSEEGYNEYYEISADNLVTV
jgi:predicted RNase H-like HicB family nuclease